jgi:hypothetical protein
MKRIKLNTTIKVDTSKKLDTVRAKQGLRSKGRAIDYLAEKEVNAGATKARSSSNNPN